MINNSLHKLFACSSQLTIPYKRIIHPPHVRPPPPHILFTKRYHLLSSRAQEKFNHYIIAPIIHHLILIITLFSLGSKIYLLLVSIFCVGLPMLTIIGCHVGIFFKIKQANKMFMDRSLSKQSSKAEIEFIRVSKLS